MFFLKRTAIWSFFQEELYVCACMLVCLCLWRDRGILISGAFNCFSCSWLIVISSLSKMPHGIIGRHAVLACLLCLSGKNVCCV